MSLVYDAQELYDEVGAKAGEDPLTSVLAAAVTDLLHRVRALEPKPAAPAASEPQGA